MKRLALNTDGILTYCTVEDPSEVKGRCNHVLHQNNNENNADFYKRAESKVKEIQEEKKKIDRVKAMSKIIVKGLTVAALAIALTGCAQKHLGSNSNSSNEPKTEQVTPSATEQSNSSNASGDSTASTGNKKHAEELMANIQVKEKLENIKYDRKLWGSNDPSYTYTDEKGKSHKTSSSNRAGFYNSLSYNRETGVFTDPYDPTLQYTAYAGTEKKAKELKQPDNVNYDHIIPLSYVARAIGGDDKWSAEKRNTYAYDLEVGVTASQHLNNVKGAKGPSQFLPPDRKAAIKYCYTWLVVANKYDIPIASNDMQVIKDTLANASDDEITIINPYYEGTDTDGTN